MSGAVMNGAYVYIPFNVYLAHLLLTILLLSLIITYCVYKLIRAFYDIGDEDDE